MQEQEFRSLPVGSIIKFSIPTPKFGIIFGFFDKVFFWIPSGKLFGQAVTEL